jgi:hypothetical protein
VFNHNTVLLFMPDTLEKTEGGGKKRKWEKWYSAHLTSYHSLEDQVLTDFLRNQAEYYVGINITAIFHN